MHQQWIIDNLSNDDRDGLQFPMAIDIDAPTTFSAFFRSPDGLVDIRLARKEQGQELDWTITAARVIGWTQRRLPFKRIELKGHRISEFDFEVLCKVDDVEIGNGFLQQIPDKPLPVATHNFSWIEFRDWAFSNEVKECSPLFRGLSSNKHGLKTALARKGRLNIWRYCSQEITAMAARVQGHLNHAHDVRTFGGLVTLLGVAQHHGFPTPLMDWTYSPFIAAYFAYKYVDTQKSYKEDERVRIWCIKHYTALPYWSAPQFSSDFPNNPFFGAEPILARLELPTLGNHRAFPQQATAIATNYVCLDYLLEPLADSGVRLPNPIASISMDLPLSDARAAMRDLRMMGIADSSMFPGLDGIFSHLTNELFSD